MAHIMVVDDEHTIRLTVRLALQHIGHTVETAADGADALKLFGDGSAWDLVLLDQRMPGIEGVEVLRTMRRIDPSAKVIIITAFGTVDLAIDAMRSGARDLLRKPFTADTLRGAVKTVLEEPDSRRDDDALAGLTTVNGFRIVERKPAQTAPGMPVRQRLVLRSPNGNKEWCTVEIAADVVDEVSACVGRPTTHTDNRFWSGLCESVLANYVWQNAEMPSGGFVRADELTGVMRRWLAETLATADGLEAVGANA